MKILRVVATELIGMFIDDGNLALLVLVLIAAATAAVMLLGLPPLAGGILLLAGCVAILALSVLRGAKR